MDDSGRNAGRRFLNWLFISGHRRAVTVALAVTVYLAMLGLTLVEPVDARRILTEQNTVQMLLNTLLSGVILLVSIVVSINSLVVSQELAPIGSQHERVVESWDFREEAAQFVDGAVSPADPSGFLLTIMEAVRSELDELEERASDLDGEPKIAVTEYVETTRDGLSGTESVLQTAEFGSFDEALFGPAYDPSPYIDDGRALYSDSSDLPESVGQSLNDIVTALQYFATAREYFKTVYYKREFSYLSRDLLYTGLPAILLISYVLLAVDGIRIAGSTLGVDNLFLFLTFAYVVALTPFLVLTSYTLRAAIVSENTITAGAFIIEE
ncbi:hypothetical protein [Halomicrococcus gelatinilyticus]|uniref:hypothetical protein n=1 Tax=Halomicrococcus gelatinilyticus TaxID=1702103 RepID=UPI002E12A5E3